MPFDTEYITAFPFTTTTVTTDCVWPPQGSQSSKTEYTTTEAYLVFFQFKSVQHSHSVTDAAFLVFLRVFEDINFNLAVVEVHTNFAFRFVPLVYIGSADIDNIRPELLSGIQMHKVDTYYLLIV